MKKRTYRAKNVNKINWTQITERLTGELNVFAIDVAKQKQCKRSILNVIPNPR